MQELPEDHLHKGHLPQNLHGETSPATRGKTGLVQNDRQSLLNKGRSQATWGLSRTNRRPNVVDKLHMTLAEVTPVQAEEEYPLQIQSDIDDIERETSNLMAAARDEEEQDEESPTQRRRTRRGSNPPSAPSAKPGRTATTRERFKPLRTPTRCQCTVN